MKNRHEQNSSICRIARNVCVWALLAVTLLSCFPLNASADTTAEIPAVQESADPAAVQESAAPAAVQESAAPEEKQPSAAAASESPAVLAVQSTDYVCKIGNTPYYTIQSAVTAVPNNGTAVIELLKNVSLTYGVTINRGKNITFTKAAEDAAVYPYEGTSGSIPQIVKNAYGFDMITVNGASNVSFSNVCVNANNLSGWYYGLYVLGGSSVTLGSGSSIINAVGYQGSAAYVTNSSSFTMQGDSSISGCTSFDAAAVDLSNGSVMTMTDSSSIHDNTGTGHGSAVFVRLSGTKSTLNIGGNASVYNNTSTSNNVESGTIVFHHDAGTLNISGSAQIYGNTNGFAAIRIPGGNTMNMTGGSITGNTTVNDSSALTGGAAAVAYNGTYPTVNLSGSPVISGNTNNRTANQKDLYLDSYTSLNITDDLTPNASVGIFCRNRMTSGSRFGSTASPGASSVGGLYTLFNDNNTGNTATDLFGFPGTGNQVIWGSGTCQIIRGGVRFGVYATLKEACEASASGDTIEIFKSHSLTGTAPVAAKTGITIKTAPVDTPTVPGAYTFMPVGTETDQASVTRSSSFTDGNCLYITGSSSSVTVTNVRFDGYSAVTNRPFVNVMGGTLNLTGSEIVNSGGGALFGYIGTTLNVSGCSFSGNSATNGGAILSAANLTVADSVFENNRSTGTDAQYGGGAVAAAGTAVLRNSVFTNNEAVSGGGAVKMFQLYTENTLTVDGCTMSENMAGSGSAVYLASAVKAVLEGTNSITGNTASSDHGGAVYVTDSAAGVLTLKDSPTVSGNTALGSDSNVTLSAGGIIYVDGALTSASVGVTVSPEEHVILHKFAENYNDAGTAVSTDNAAASKNVFFDDRTYKMGIGANRTDAGMDASFDTYNYFIGTKYLGISKTVTGNMADTDKQYTFAITIAGDGGGTINGSFNCTIAGTDHTITFADGAVTSIDGNAANTAVVLRSGERILIRGVPYGMTYSVTEEEANADGYKTSYCITDLDSDGNASSVRTSSSLYTAPVTGTVGDAGKQVDVVNDKTHVSYPTGVRTGSDSDKAAILLVLFAAVLIVAGRLIRKHKIHGKVVFLILFFTAGALLLVPSESYAEDRITAEMPAVTVKDTGTVPDGTVHTIVIQALGGAPLPENRQGDTMELSAEANSTVSPGNLFFSVPGIYHYTVCQRAGENADCTADSSTYGVSVYVLHDDAADHAEFIVECGGRKYDSLFFCNSWPERLTVQHAGRISGGKVQTGDDHPVFPAAAALLVSLLISVAFRKRGRKNTSKGDV